MNRSFLRYAAILGSLLIAGINPAYSDPLTEQDMDAFNQVLPAGNYDNVPLKVTMTLKDSAGKDIVVYQALKGGKVTGVAYEIISEGYSGDIRLIMGVDPTGKVLGVRVLSHNERRGDKIETKKSDWILGFTGKSLGSPPADQWKIKKEDGQIDQIAGATTTSRNVITAVRQGLEFFAANKAQLTAVK